MNKTKERAMNKTKERAWEILRLYLEAVKELPFIRSIILVGSLSDGTYTGNAGSDIDLVHIVRDGPDYAEQKRRILEKISEVEERTEKDIPISRVVYQERHLVHPYPYDFAPTEENKALMERPIEVLRILDSGITVYGEDLLASLEAPTREDIRMTKRLNAQCLEAMKDTEWYRGYIKMCDRPTLPILTQIVLTTALSDYYFYTGHNCSSKYRILSCVEKELPSLSYLNLLRLCHKNRFSPDLITEEDRDAMHREYQTVFKLREKTWEL